MVIYDPAGVIREYLPGLDLTGARFGAAMPQDLMTVLRLDLQRRLAEMNDFLGHDRTIIVFPPPPLVLHATDAGGTPTGEQLRILDLVPAGPIRTSLGSGTNVDFVGDATIQSFWEVVRGTLCYDAVLDAFKGRACFTVTGTRKIVGGVADSAQGRVLFLPRLAMGPGVGFRQQSEYIQALLDLNEALVAVQHNDEPPEWTNSYLLRGEAERLNALAAANQAKSDADSALAAESSSLNGLRSYKLLFIGTGEPLRQKVKQALCEIGLHVEDGPEGRDDLVSTDRHRPVVIEVKGVKASASERDAAQLEKWVTGYYERKCVLPKGILVVNAYRETPLEKRNQPAFPDQMLGYSKGRSHCLVTGLQLLGLLTAVREGGVSSAEAVNSLLSTVGPYAAHNDFTRFVDLTDAT